MVWSNMDVWVVFSVCAGFIFLVVGVFNITVGQAISDPSNIFGGFLLCIVGVVLLIGGWVGSFISPEKEVLEASE